MKRVDVAVVGAGFGGLAAALSLAERGARVHVCEALAYPGGCASSFRRGGHGYEAGATLFSGLADGQVFGRWRRTHGIDVEFDFIDPVVEHRTPGWSIAVHRDRGQVLEQLARLPGAPRAELAQFFRFQEEIGDTLWELFDHPEELPPSSARGLLWHFRRLGRYARLAGAVGTPLASLLRDRGLADFAPFRGFVDALCQITVQCPAAEAEAPFALGAMDYFWRGTGHVRGGIGRLASGLVGAIERAGGTVSFADAVRRITPSASGFVLETRRGALEASGLAMNVLPHAVGKLMDPTSFDRVAIDRLRERVDGGWGAVMLYLRARPPAGAPEHAQHLDLLLDPARPPIEGNHLFASISAAGEHGATDGQRSITVSTHVSLRELSLLSEPDRAARVATIQDRLRSGLSRLAPEWWAGVTSELTASPRTFQRFTGREGGAVGGVPRRAGLQNYVDVGPFRVRRRAYLVGDSVFPGQSTLATAVGGIRVAAKLADELGLPGTRAAE